MRHVAWGATRAWCDTGGGIGRGAAVRRTTMAAFYCVDNTKHAFFATTNPAFAPAACKAVCKATNCACYDIGPGPSCRMTNRSRSMKASALGFIAGVRGG